MAGQKNESEIEFPKPDYEVIKKYITDRVINDIYFRQKYELYFTYPEYEYKKFADFITDENLLTDHNIYFFWVYFSDGYGYSKWQTDTEDFKTWSNYNQDLKKLKLFFKDLDSMYQSRLSDGINKDLLVSLTIKSNKKKVTITAHPLLYDIFFQLRDWVDNKHEGTTPKEKNVRTYLKDFIRSTKSLYQYLKENNFKDKPDNDIYSFIADFVQSIGYDWEHKDNVEREDYIRKSYS